MAVGASAVGVKERDDGVFVFKDLKAPLQRLDELFGGHVLRTVG